MGMFFTFPRVIVFAVIFAVNSRVNLLLEEKGGPLAVDEVIISFCGTTFQVIFVYLISHLLCKCQLLLKGEA